MKIKFFTFCIFIALIFFMQGISIAQIQTPGNYSIVSGNTIMQTLPSTITDMSPMVPILSQSFDAVTFPPAGWTRIIGTGTFNWERATNGTYPTCTPHTGAGMIFYNSYTATSGFYATLITPVVNLTGNTGFHAVKMWMYHDPGYTSDPDRVEILVNTTPSLTGAALIGTVNRYNAVASWTEHAFAIPAIYSTTTNYILFKAVSSFGNNIYVDDISVIQDAKDVGVTAIISPEVGMLPGSIIPQITIKNYGNYTQTNIPVSYKIGTSGTVNTINVPSLAAGATTNVSFPLWTGALGTYNFIFYTELLEDDILGNDTIKRDLSVVSKLNKAYCLKDNNQPSSFILENPIGGFTNMGNTVPWLTRAGVYFSTSETAYKWLVLGSDKRLYSMDTLTGVANFIGATGAPDDFLSGLTYDKSTHTLYASGLSGTYPNFNFKLYTINQTNGSATLVATSTRTGFFTDIACNTSGQLFAIEFRPDSTGKFYSLNKTTAELTLIGTNLGAKISSSPQDIEFTDNNILYFTASKGNDGVLDGLYTINTTTGKATLVSSFKLTNTPVGGLGIKTAFGASIHETTNTKDEINIFPNPIKEFISVVSKNNETIKTVKVISLSGQLVYSETVNHIATTINTTDMSAGFYFVQVLTNKGLFTQKIVVTK